MFTGLVEELGAVADVTALGDGIRLGVRSTTALDGVALGDSIAVNGCCLTVAEIDGSLWRADVMPESLARTTLGTLRAGDRVNLERAATLQTRLGGHLVQGHVDGVGTVLARRHSEHWAELDVAVPDGLERYLVEKGSVTVDGVSLTVVDAGESRFSVSLIPETLSRTTLGVRVPGDPVNLEVDLIAKYVERLLTRGEQAMEDGVEHG